MTTATTTPGGPLDALIASWLRSLRARNLSAQTLATYAAAAHQFDAHLAAAGAPAVTDVTRADVEDFITSLLGTRPQRPRTTATARCSSSSAGCSTRRRSTDPRWSG